MLARHTDMPAGAVAFVAGGAGALGEAEAGEEAAFWSLLSSAQAEAAAAKRSGDAIDLMAGGFDLATG